MNAPIYRSISNWFFISAACVLLLALARPAAAYSGIEIEGYDAVTLQPWGTAPGQSYRILIFNTTDSTVILDTGTLTTPGDPVLDHTCAYTDLTCAGVAWDTSSISTGDNISIYVTMTGTSGNPQTQIQSYSQPPVDLGTYTMRFNTGTTPTAVTLSGAGTAGSLPWGAALVGLLLLGVGTGAVLWERRRAAVSG